MKYRLLGKSGLRVSEIALGTMTFGKEWGSMGAEKDDCKKIFDVYVNAGGNFIDTANRYQEGTSEIYTGEFIAHARDSFVLATKYTLTNPGRKGDILSSGNSRKNLVYSVEHSLKRLKTDYIDLLWLHAWDYLTPIEEVMRALDDMIRAGKVLYIGISDTPAWIVAQGNTLAELKGWTQFIALQVEYSLIQRDPERELIPMANAFEMAVTPWAALGGGALTGKYLNSKKDGEPRRVPEGSKRINERNTEIAREVVKIADELGVTPAQVALNWVRQQKGTFIPIVGARKEEQMKDSLGCLNFTLPEKIMHRLNEVSKIVLGFPHDFLKEPNISDIVYSGRFNDIIK